VWFAAAGSSYVFGTWDAARRAFMLGGARLPLTVLTAVSPGLVWIFLAMAARRRGITRSLALATGASQLVVIALNVVSRQIDQSFVLRRHLDLHAAPVHVPWVPMLFLALLLFGLMPSAWMIREAIRAFRPRPSPDDTIKEGRFRPT